MRKKNLQLLCLLTALIIPFMLGSCTKKVEVVTPETALQRYLNNEDESFSFELSGSVSRDDLVAYSLILTSQQWREHTWKHRLTILVPNENNHDGALLFITGGKNKDGEPVKRSGDDDIVKSLSYLAVKNKAMIAIIWQTPNQPLYDDLTEDELISFTLHNFKNDGDYTWPLLFPMVKTAVRSMDAVQKFSEENLNHKISSFVLTGASKRGWTTWLTGAHDKRVKAIAPMVIDVLNMPVNLKYQITVWDDYSVQIQDYVDLGIPQGVDTESGRSISTMVDPYSYRHKLTMPKLIFIGTNDEYWPVDAIKHYLDDIPGENYIHYVPNAGHDLNGGEQAFRALSAFFGRTLSNEGYPICDWSISETEEQFSLTVMKSPEEFLGALIWTADSQDRDFRDELWSSNAVTTVSQDQVEVQVNYPESGFRAFYLDLRYSDPNGGEYTKSTKMFVVDDEKFLVD
ncbi:MAG: PhoPQ-activated pathogenicity-like protein PqaA type [Bacteroidales bacterium]|nr:PhoPQ-activated pathogenicity-like protein PqaA type [Bacteroidales bacterium]